MRQIATNCDNIAVAKAAPTLQNIRMKNAELFSPAELSECESIPEGVFKKLKSDEAAGRYTAQSLKKNKPQIYKAITAMIGADLPFGYIAASCGVHFYTVEAVAKCESDYISKCKDRLAKMGFSVSQRMLEKISENLDNIKLNKTDDFYKATLITNKLAESANLLSGGVTERVEVEVKKSYSSAEEYEREMWGEAEVIETQPNEEEEK